MRATASPATRTRSYGWADSTPSRASACGRCTSSGGATARRSSRTTPKPRLEDQHQPALIARRQKAGRAGSPRSCPPAVPPEPSRESLLEMLAEELDRLISAPSVAAFEKVEFEEVRCAGRGVDLLDLAVAAHGRLDLEAGVVRADLDQQRLGGDQPVQVGHVAQRVKARRDLAAAEVDVADAEVREPVAVADDVGGLHAVVDER